MQRVIFWLSMIATICSTVVFVQRGLNAWVIAGIPPGVATTSGFEEESLFALHRAVHHQPVYLDNTRLPFAAAYFNWLFYASYSAPLRPVVTRYGDAAMPRFARILTAVGGLMGVLMLGLIGRWLLAEYWPVTIPVATWVFFGPLVGWWAHTARPDVWALACEATAIALLLRHLSRRPILAVVGAMVFFYAAWAFKPTYIFGLGTATAFLAVRRRLVLATILTGGSLALWMVTYWLIDPGFRATMQSTAAVSDYYFLGGWKNLVNAGLKTAPLIVLTAGLLYSRFPADGELPTDNVSAADAAVFGSLGVVLTTPVMFWASCKVGAWSNYFFTPLLMLAVLSLGLAAQRPAPAALAAFLALSTAMQIFMLAGKAGRIDLRPLADELSIRWARWESQPEPRFSADTRLNLPWLNAHSPPLVLSFNYGFDRAAGRRFESGGLGGLISAGYFATLLLPEGEMSSYDGSDLRLYRKGSTAAGMSVYLLKNP